MPEIRANFLTAGAHWATLASEVRVLAERKAPPPLAPRSSSRLLTTFPAWIPTAPREIALNASRELRTGRNLVFAHAVELQHGDGVLRFEPLRRGPMHVEVPVMSSHWSEGAVAELLIDGKRDPLSLRFSGEDADENRDPRLASSARGLRPTRLSARPDSAPAV